MYTPAYRKKRSGIPVLSKRDIDIIGERLVGDFYPDAVQTPMTVDIDGFAQCYLGLKQDFQFLSHNGIYLGMMVFSDTSKVPVYDPSTKRAEYISVSARTIIIDNGLLDESQEHRYRFTVGHEAAHDIFHSAYFAKKPNHDPSFNTNNIPMVQCRIDTSKNKMRPLSLWTDNDWMEWQANRLSSAVLMPASMVVKLISDQPPEHTAFRAACWVMAVHRTFNVSIQAAEIRLRDLGMINGIPKYALEEELTIFAG